MAAARGLLFPWRFVRPSRFGQATAAPVLRFHTTASPMMGATVEQFNQAKSQLAVLKEDPGNMVKLQIYALFKQSTEGTCTAPKPGMLDFVKKAKWDAWKALGSISQDEARQQYCDLIGSLVTAEGGSSQVVAAAAGSGPTYTGLQVTTEDSITTIMLNRPNKKNAITSEMYDEITAALDNAAKDSSVLTVITGAGDFYCSGNDLNNFAKIPPSQIAEMAKATFHTPFSQLGQSPEGCSSYTFPKIMGATKASEMLLFNKKLTATQACAQGLVTEVFPDASFQTESLALSKQLIRATEMERLHTVNDAEVDRLLERWQSDECMSAIMSFFQGKSKL
ncbi:hypothetical protein CRUP_004560 [Coryphaenoides rupestris]|nr:hypothetical protein CRUP_004560 [Coryphaenoides rupestris]